MKKATLRRKEKQNKSLEGWYLNHRVPNLVVIHQKQLIKKKKTSFGSGNEIFNFFKTLFFQFCRH